MFDSIDFNYNSSEDRCKADFHAQVVTKLAAQLVHQGQAAEAKLKVVKQVFNPG